MHPIFIPALSKSIEQFLDERVLDVESLYIFSTNDPDGTPTEILDGEIIVGNICPSQINAVLEQYQTLVFAYLEGYSIADAKEVVENETPYISVFADAIPESSLNDAWATLEAFASKNQSLMARRREAEEEVNRTNEHPMIPRLIEEFVELWLKKCALHPAALAKMSANQVRTLKKLAAPTVQWRTCANNNIAHFADPHGFDPGDKWGRFAVLNDSRNWPNPEAYPHIFHQYFRIAMFISDTFKAWNLGLLDSSMWTPEATETAFGVPPYAVYRAAFLPLDELFAFSLNNPFSKIPAKSQEVLAQINLRPPFTLYGTIPCIGMKERTLSHSHPSSSSSTQRLDSQLLGFR